MTEDLHIVEKVMVDVDVDSMELAEKIKSEINDYIQNGVLSIVESYFQDLNLPDSLNEKVIQLEKVDLSIDASSWSPHSLHMKQEIRDEVARQMNPIIQELKDISARSEVLLPKSYSDIKEPNANVFSKEERVIKSMFYFLDHGTLPWWLKSSEESRELFKEDTLITALKEYTVLAQKEFRNRRANPRFTKRLVQQLPISVVSELIQIDLSYNQAKREEITSVLVDELRRLPPSSASKLLLLLVELSEPSVIREISKAGVAFKIYRHAQKIFHSTERAETQNESALKTTSTILRSILLIAGTSDGLSKAKLDLQSSLNVELQSKELAVLKETETYQEVFENLPTLPDETASLMKAGDLESRPRADIPSKEKSSEKNDEWADTRDSVDNSDKLEEESSPTEKDEARVTQTTKKLSEEIRTSSETRNKEQKEMSGPESDSSVAKLIPNDIPNKEKSIENDSYKLSEVLKKRIESEQISQKKEEKMPGHLFVENAGLVLLNPFLPALFKQLELVDEDGKLTDPEIAACVLHYAATGREGDYEFEMTFEKYLCGIPPSFSLSRNITLTQDQKSEVEKVLNSVLQHWTALKSQSTALLQNEFLSRSGKLIVEKSNHRLVIEKKTFDLLLDKLPWNYSLIKFSWKKELMFVEW